MKTGNLRNGVIDVGTVRYTVSALEDPSGVWTNDRLYTSDDTHMKIALAAEDLFLDDRPIEITGETHDDGSLTFRPR